MTIDYVVKKKAIDLHLQGHGRNEIARILNGQKMRISEATITHLIQRQQQKQEHNNSGPSSSTLNPQLVRLQPQLLQSRQPQHQQPSKSPKSSQSSQSPQLQLFQGPSADASISTGIDMNNTGSPSSMVQKVHSGVGQANKTNSVTHVNGGSLSHLDEDSDSDMDTTVNANTNVNANTDSNRTSIITDKEEVIPSVTSYSNLPSPVLQAPLSTLASAPTSVLSIPSKPEPFPSRDLFIKDPETEMQVIELDTNVKSRYTNQDVNSQSAAPEEEFEQSQSQPSLLSDSANTLVDWDSDETWQRRFFKLMDERRRREEQIRLMDQNRQELEVERTLFSKNCGKTELMQCKGLEILKMVLILQRLKYFTALVEHEKYIWI